MGKIIQQERLSPGAFAEGMTRINSILTPNMRISERDRLDTYFSALSEYSDVDFLNGVDLFLKEWDSSTKPPSIKNILDFVERAKYDGLDSDQIHLIKEIQEYLHRD